MYAETFLDVRGIKRRFLLEDTRLKCVGLRGTKEQFRLENKAFARVSMHELDENRSLSSDLVSTDLV